MDYKIGTRSASEQLIKELYIALRNEVNKWSEVTKQTPQARMGYVGQHLVSVVTGCPGGRSGARGHDLEFPDGTFGEIKTCYRVDQLGACISCGCAVSSIEKVCPHCGSVNISRKDDSKWLISIHNDDEFVNILSPSKYYFVLFDFDNISDSENEDIIASIWEVDPKTKGFAFCMMDYYINIRSASKSKAPFNMWPYSLKFQLTRPVLIYRSKITRDDVMTEIFPNEGARSYKLDNLLNYSSAKTLDVSAIKTCLSKIAPDVKIDASDKKSQQV